MNARSRQAQAALPFVAPICPHCGDRRATVCTGGWSDDTLTGAERWECRACGGVFWSLPTLAAGVHT